MSSPAAGIAMLQNRLTKLDQIADDASEESSPSDAENPVHDVDNGYESDLAPSLVVEQSEWSEYRWHRNRPPNVPLRFIIRMC